MAIQGTDWLVVVGLIVQILLALMALWLAWETRWLRLSSETQINLLSEQSRASLQPYIFPSLVIFDKEEARKAIGADEAKTPEEKAKDLSDLEKNSPIFFCSLQNATNHIARDVEVWIYDARTRNFLESDTGTAILSGKEETNEAFSPPFLSVEEVRLRVISRYGNAAGTIANSTEVGKISYLLVVYRDIEKRVYSTRRNFSINNDKVRHLPDIS